MIYTKYLILITLILMLLINQNKITSSHYECMNNNNCYSYAFNNIHKKYKDKPQPGSYSNIKQVERNNKEYKCKNFIHRVLRDYPQSRFISVDDYKSGSRCKDNEYTIFLALDNEGISTDYHFYKENQNIIELQETLNREYYFTVSIRQQQIPSPFLLAFEFISSF